MYSSDDKQQKWEKSIERETTHADLKVEHWGSAWV